MKKICMVLAFVLFLNTAQKAAAADYGVSISPVTLLGLVFTAANANPIGYFWLAADFNFLLNESKEKSIGLFLQSYYYGLRYQQRKYTRNNHSGLFYGLFAQLEFRQMGWEYTTDDEGKTTLKTNYAFMENSIHGNIFSSVGVTLGGDVGFRLRGEKWGATFFVGAGLPLFHCFGDLPPKEDMAGFYLENALLRAFEIGLKIDFYI